VLKEETVATSLAGLVCDPSAFIVEEYSEEVGDFKDADGMNIAQEVFIDHEPSTITYEVREVDSSSDPMFPGSEAGQELVLHTLEQIPEDERFPIHPYVFFFTDLFSRICFYTHVFNLFCLGLNPLKLWPQDLKGRSEEKTRKAAKVSDLRDRRGWQEVVLMQRV